MTDDGSGGSYRSVETLGGSLEAVRRQLVHIHGYGTYPQAIAKAEEAGEDAHLEECVGKEALKQTLETHKSSSRDDYIFELDSCP